MKRMKTILPMTLLIIGCGGGGPSDIKEKRDVDLDTKISGIIYEDENRNGIWDSTENGTDKIKLTISDSNGIDYTVYTNEYGKFHISKLAHGMATISIDSHSLPTDSVLSSNDIIEFEIKPYVQNIMQAIAYTLPQINSDKESTEEEVTDENGILAVNVEVQTTDEHNETNVTIIKAGNNFSSGESNITNIFIKVGEVHGRIFLDFDESYDYGTGDEGLEGIDVVITDIRGTHHNVVTDEKGIYTAKNIPVGNAIVQVKDRDTIEAFRGRVAKTKTINDLREGRSTQNFTEDANVSVNVVSGQRNKAASIGYFATSATLGLLSGTCFYDSNRNGIYDDTDERLVGITVNIIDSMGTVYTAETRDESGHIAYKGTFQVAVPPGVVTIIYDKNDVDLPAYNNTIGYEVDTDIVEIGKKTYSGGYGFTEIF